MKNGVIRFPLGRGRHAPIAVEDQGRVIAAVLMNPAPHVGKTYPLFGPVELDHYQIAEKLTATLEIMAGQTRGIVQIGLGCKRGGPHTPQ